MKKFYQERKMKYYKKYFLNSSKRNIYWTNGFTELPVDVYNFILKFIDINGYILDLGCGNGLLLKYLISNSKYRLIPFGIDFQELSIEEAKEVVIPEFKDNFHVGYIDDIDFNNNFFDYIMIDPYHIVDAEREKIIKKILKKIKNKGSLILYAYHDSMSALGHSKIKNFIGMEHFKLANNDFVLPDKISINILCP